ncbi:MAG TPA: NAD-dependent epimerase/dehydratase family protein [Steroidobacteraceae bacterium]|nr:NAD-dependent epimerase/dehydratase family protein [Steroidobacteraceae bacterium]
MNLLITGANGFVGKALTSRLLSESALPRGLGPLGRLTLMDLGFEGPEVPRVRRLPGSFADPALLARAFDTPVDVVFHLASVPGGLAEQNYELGRQVNVDATIRLLEAARAQMAASTKPPVFVFASSIAVLGSPLPALVDDATPRRPQLSYGAHKLIGEILLEDFSRRGWVDGRSVRLPGIVARPPQRSGLMSAFLSDIFRELAEGRSFVCPVSADSTTWLMSVHCIVDNLLHAATLSAAECKSTRVWTLPALCVSMSEVVEAIAEVYGRDVLERVSYQSHPALEANFGRYPPLVTAAADAAGFRHDGDLPTLVRRALLPIH